MDEASCHKKKITESVTKYLFCERRVTKLNQLALSWSCQFRMVAPSLGISMALLMAQCQLKMLVFSVPDTPTQAPLT